MYLEQQQTMSVDQVELQIQAMRGAPEMQVFFNTNVDQEVANLILDLANNPGMKRVVMVAGETGTGKEALCGGILHALTEVLGDSCNYYYGSTNDFVKQGMLRRGFDPILKYDDIGQEDLYWGNVWINRAVSWFRSERPRDKAVSEVFLIETLAIDDPNPRDPQDNAYHPIENPTGYQKLNIGGNLLQECGADIAFLFSTRDEVQKKSLRKRRKFYETRDIRELGHDYDSDVTWEELYQSMAPAPVMEGVIALMNHNLMIHFPGLTLEDLQDPDIRYAKIHEYLIDLVQEWDLDKSNMILKIVDNPEITSTEPPQQPDDAKTIKHRKGLLREHKIPWGKLPIYNEEPAVIHDWIEGDQNHSLII